MSRTAAVLLRSPRAVPPPGIDPLAYADALAEDTYEVLASLAGVTPAIVVADPCDLPRADALIWPGTPIHVLSDTTDLLRAALTVLLVDADMAVVVSDDVPDLPGLLIGKLFAALADHEIACAPAAGGGLVAVAVRSALPGWLANAELDLDASDAGDRLRAAAPRRALAPPTPGWHRLRHPADVGVLDEGLSGWEATRALLGGRRN